MTLQRSCLEAFILDPSESNWIQCINAGFNGESDVYSEWRLYPHLLPLIKEFECSEKVIENVAQRSRRIYAFNKKAIVDYQEALALLNEAGINYVLMKGAALIADQLTNETKRVLADVDVLLPSHEVDRALKVLMTSNQWMLDVRYKDVNRVIDREVHLTNGQHAIFDLHWFPFSYFQSDRIVEEFLTDKRTSSIWNLETFVPSVTHLFFNVMIHGSVSEQGIQWILDSRLILEREEIDWDLLLKITKKYHLLDVTRNAFSQLHEYIPDEVITEIERQPRHFVEMLENNIGEEVPINLWNRVLSSVVSSSRYFPERPFFLFPITLIAYQCKVWDCLSFWDFIRMLFKKIFLFKPSEIPKE